MYYFVQESFYKNTILTKSKAPYLNFLTRNMYFEAIISIIFEKLL